MEPKLTAFQAPHLNDRNEKINYEETTINFSAGFYQY